MEAPNSTLPFQQRVPSLINGRGPFATPPPPQSAANMVFSSGFIKDAGSTTPNGVDRVDMDGGGEDLDHLG